MSERPEKKIAKRKPRVQKSGGITAWFQHHQKVAVDSLDRLLQEKSGSFLTWTVIGIALALPLCLLLLLQNLQQFGSDLDEATNISLFMELTLSEEELEEVNQNLSIRGDIKSIQLISSTQALEEFQNVSDFADVLKGLDENPLPAVLVLSPTMTNIEEVEALLDELQQLEGVDSAQLDLEWIRRLNSILGLAERMTIILAALLCVGVVLVVGNTVRLEIENRRAEIVVVKLVGGTDAYVARPFLYTGLWYGVGGGIIACILVLVAQFSLMGPVSKMAGLYESDFILLGFKISDILLVLVCSGVLGWIGAWLSVLRHLKAIEPK